MKHMRQDYTSGRCTYRQYYGQYVTKELQKEMTENVRDFLKMTKRAPLEEWLKVDPNMNSIPLAVWDLWSLYTRQPGFLQFMASCGDCWSPAGSVCILKLAVTMQIEEEEKQKEHTP